ncbi:MAG: hypothetical protein AABY47_09885 [Pseudomonadota bacterium]
MQKRMMNVILISGLLLLPVIGLAQKNNAASNNNEGINRISKELGLDETQKSKIEAIFTIERKKVEAVFADERKKLQSIQEETRSSLQAVLTPEQMDKLDKKMRQQNSQNKTQKK